MENESKIHRMVQSEDVNKRKEALHELERNFIIFTDKSQATKDLLALAKDQDSGVRSNVAYALISAFPHVTDKSQATKDLLALAKDQDSDVRYNVTEVLGSVFPHVADKSQATKDLLALTKDSDSVVRRRAVWTLGSAFPHVTDKSQATKDLLVLAKDQDSVVRQNVAYALISAFPHVTDKSQATKDLLALAKDQYRPVRQNAAYALGSAFPHVTDRSQAWKDLLNLTKDQDSDVRYNAACALGLAFPHVTDKSQATKDLLALTKVQDGYVQKGVAYALGSAFPYVTDKSQATKDLLALTKVQKGIVQTEAIQSLGLAFPHVTDKSQATKDLLALTKDLDSDVQLNAIYVLGSAFPHITDKSQATTDLLALTKDSNKDVRAYANHSLGKIHVFNAIEADEESFRKELEKALEFFEISSQEQAYHNPAKFCLPFYRSFYTITFKKEEAEAEVKRYLADAKSAVEGSKSKEKLLEAVENLGNALKEAQRVRDLNDVKCDLNTYRLYCEHAADMLDETEDKAPGAARLVRKGLPIIDKRIKQILAEIQQRANIACKQSKGTPNAELACKINQEVQKWQISDQEQMTQNVKNLIFILKSKIQPHPANKEIYENIEKIGKEKDVIKQYQLIGILIALIPQTVIGGIMTNEYVGGDKIVANHSSIVSKSSFSNAINNIKENGNDEIAKAIKDLAKLIENSSFENKKETIENVESLAEEAAKQNPRKGTMRVLGESILNSVQKVSGVVEKVSPLIKIISKLWLEQ